MKLNSNVLRFMKDTNMAEYQTIKAEFLYHSNKIEEPLHFVCLRQPL
ncbi:MAG: hypothetical protein R3Y53_11395 [Bacillota bacterium]